MTALRNNIRKQLVFGLRDLIANLQFAFFQALHLQAVTAGRCEQRVDRGIKIAMLLSQPFKIGAKFTFLFVFHVAAD